MENRIHFLILLLPRYLLDSVADAFIEFICHNEAGLFLSIFGSEIKDPDDIEIARMENQSGDRVSKRETKLTHESGISNERALNGSNVDE